MKRIGPKMLRVASYVASDPGCPKIRAAWYASPWPGNALRSCGLAYGYRSVDRAIAAGLVDAVMGRTGYALTLTDKGRELLERSERGGCLRLLLPGDARRGSVHPSGLRHRRYLVRARP